MAVTKKQQQQQQKPEADRHFRWVEENSQRAEIQVRVLGLLGSANGEAVAR